MVTWRYLPRGCDRAQLQDTAVAQTAGLLGPTCPPRRRPGSECCAALTEGQGTRVAACATGPGPSTVYRGRRGAGRGVQGGPSRPPALAAGLAPPLCGARTGLGCLIRNLTCGKLAPGSPETRGPLSAKSEVGRSKVMAVMAPRTFDVGTALQASFGEPVCCS
jgi:hypothetical protein